VAIFFILTKSQKGCFRSQKRLLLKKALRLVPSEKKTLGGVRSIRIENTEVSCKKSKVDISKIEEVHPPPPPKCRPWAIPFPKVLRPKINS